MLIDCPVLCEDNNEFAFSIPDKAVFTFSICVARPDAESAAVSSPAPVLEEMTPSCTSMFTRLFTCSLDESDITPHWTAASTRELTASSPSWIPSVSNAYLKSVSVRFKSFNAFALSDTVFPKSEKSLPLTAFVNLSFAIAVSFS